MKLDRVLIRAISLIITGIFIFQQVAWTAEDSNIPSPAFNSYRENLTEKQRIIPSDIYIPEDLAQIETKNFDISRELIFNLQDCHSSLSAQYSIVNILKKLLNNYDVSIVAIEGASGYIDTSIMRSFPDRKVKEDAAAVLMKQGKLSAGEFFSVVTDEDIALYGVEDQDLYRQNLETFRKLYRENKDTLVSVKKIISDIEKVEDRTYSKELSMFIFKSRLHKASKISFDIYSKYLIDLCVEKEIDTLYMFNIKGFRDVIKIEKGVDFDAATLESKELLSELMSVAEKPELEEMVLKTLDFNKDKIGPVEYHEWLLALAAKKGKSTADIKELVKYVDYIRHYQTLDIIGLQAEIDLTEKLILEKLFSDEKEKKLYEQAEIMRMTKALFSIQLTPEDVIFVKENLSRLNPEYLEKTVGSENAGSIAPQIIAKAYEALDFYEVAEKRNIAMLSNTIESMRAEGKHMAALISGGHHSKGLSNLMRDEGISYFILMPKYSVDSERPYVAILTKKEGPYRDLIKTGAYDLALEAYFDTGDLDQFHEMIALVLGKWVINDNIDINSVMTEWADSYEEHYNNISDARKEFLLYSPLEPDDFRSFLDEVKLVETKEGSCTIGISGKFFAVDTEGIRYDLTPEKGTPNLISDPEGAVRIKEIIEKYHALGVLLKPLRRISAEEINTLFPGMALSMKPIAGVLLNYVRYSDREKEKPGITYDKADETAVETERYSAVSQDSDRILTARDLISTLDEGTNALDPELVSGQFLTDLPPRITKKHGFSKQLFRQIYNSLNSVLEDPERVIVSFFERDAAIRASDERQKIVMVYLSLDKMVQQAGFLRQKMEKDPEIKLGKKDGFSVSLPGSSNEEKLFVDVFTVTKKNSYLEAEEKEALLSELEMAVYPGFTSPEGRMTVGYAAFRDSGDALTVRDIVYNIIPVGAQYNRENVRIILNEYLDGLDKVLDGIRRQLTNIPYVFDRIVEETKKDFLRLPTEGKRIYKLRPEMLLSSRIEQEIALLEDKDGLQEKVIKDELNRLNAYIKEKIQHFERTGSETLIAEKESFDAAIEEVIEEEVGAASSDERMAEMINTVLSDIKRKVDKELNSYIKAGSGYRVVIILEKMEKIYRDLISRTKLEIKDLAGKDKERKEKFLDDFQFILDLLKKTASYMSHRDKSGASFLPDQFTDTGDNVKYILFVEGDLLPSDIKKTHENIAAFVTATAGTSAHWVLVANNFNIPVFHLTGKAGPVSVKELQKDISPGMLVAVNGIEGELIADPDDETLRQFRKESREQDAYEIFCAKEAKKKAYPGKKTGNVKKAVMVKANADEKAELIAAFSKGADGIGLVRTEEFWLSAEDTPGLKDFIEDINNSYAQNQVKDFFKEKALALLRHALRKNEDGEFEISELALRTIDVADDKQVPFDPSDLTGMRYYRERATGNALLELQLEAVYESVFELIRILIREKDKDKNAFAGMDPLIIDPVVRMLKGKIKLKFPQVESRSDIAFALEKIEDIIETVSIDSGAPIEEARDLLRAVVKVGSMIESRGSIGNLEEILPLSDFISIGSNDLIRDIYRSEVERYLGKNLRRDIRARRFTKEIRGRVLDEFERIIRKVAKHNAASEEEILITVCGDTATIDGYTLQILYLCDKYGVDVALSVPRIKIGETKAFIRYADVNALEPLFERDKESGLFRIEGLIWELIDDIDILEVLSNVITQKNRRKTFVKVQDIADKAAEIKALIDDKSAYDPDALLERIIEDSDEAINEFMKEPDQIKETLKDYLSSVRRRISMLDMKIGQRGKIEKGSKQIRDRIHAEPEIKNIAKILLEKDLFPAAGEKEDTGREDIESLFEEITEEAPVEDETAGEVDRQQENRVESVYLRVNNKQGLHGRPAIDLFTQPKKLGVTVEVEDGYSSLQKGSVKDTYENFFGAGSWTGKVDEPMFFVYLQATKESLLKLRIEGPAERVRLMLMLIDNLDDKRTITIDEGETGEVRISLKDQNAEEAEETIINRSGKTTLIQLSPLDAGEKIFDIIDRIEFKKSMDELLPGREKEVSDQEGYEEEADMESTSTVSGAEEHSFHKEMTVEIIEDLSSALLKPLFYIVSAGISAAVEDHNVKLEVTGLTDKNGNNIALDKLETPFNLFELKDLRSFETEEKIFKVGNKIAFRIKGEEPGVRTFARFMLDVTSRGKKVFKPADSAEVTVREALIDLFAGEEIGRFEAGKILSSLKKYQGTIKLLAYETADGLLDIPLFTINAQTDISEIQGLGIRGAGTLKVEISSGEDDIEKIISELFEIDTLHVRTISDQKPGLDLGEEISADKTSTFPGATEPEKEIDLNLALPEVLYREIESSIGINGFVSKLDLPFDVKIIKVKSSLSGDISGEVDALTENKKGIVLILDPSALDQEKSPDELIQDAADVIFDFSKTLRDDVLELLAPGTGALNSISIKALDKYKVRDIMGILVRTRDKYRSYALNEKSVYQMRIENAFDTYKSQPESAKLIEAAINDRGTKYLTHFADASEFTERKDLLIVPPGVEIQRRRSAQGFDDKEDTYKDKFYIAAPYENMTDQAKYIFKKKLMDLWMLTDIVSEEDITILDRKSGGYKTSEIYSALNRTDSNVNKNNTGIRVICGALEYDENNAEAGILQLELPEKAKHNRDQYEIFVNLMNLQGKEDTGIFLPGQVIRKGSNLFIYLPASLPVELDREIRSYYDRYREEILIKA